MLPLVQLGRSGGELVHPYESLTGLPVSRMDALLPLLGPEPFFQRLLDGGLPLARIQSRIRRNSRIEEILTDTGGFWSWNSLEKPGDGACESASKAMDLLVQPIFKRRDGALESWGRILDRASRSGSRVILLRIPFSERWNRAAGGAKLDREVGAILRDFQERFEGVEILEIPPSLLSESAGDFQDITHLSPCGARKMSSWIGSRIQGSI